MKKSMKLLALLCALLMVVGCMASCGKKEEAAGGFASLSNQEKFFYYSAKAHPAASNVVSLIGSGNGVSSPAASTGKYEAGVEVDVNKLVYESTDLLEALGGSLKVNGTVITDLSGVELDLGAVVSDLTLDIDIAADGNGFCITSPVLFTKPIYASYSDLYAMGDYSDYTDGVGVSAGVNDYAYKLLTGAPDIAAALQKWYEEKLTEANVQHIIDLLEGALPESAITVSKATPDELMGDFIATAPETECVTATVTESVAKQIYNALSQSVPSDKTLRDIIVSFIACFDNTLDADALYDEYLGNIFETSFDISDDYSEENALENGIIVINRYFADGYCVKTDIIVKDAEKTELDFTAWNVYSDKNACQYGTKVVVNGDNVFTAIGGANASEAKLNTTLNIDKSNTVSLDVQRTADEFKLNAKAKVEGALLNSEYTSGANTVNSKFTLCFDGVTCNAEYSANATGSTVAFSIDDGQDSGFNLDGTSAINGGKTVYNYTFTGKNSGVEFLKGAVDCECETVVNDSKTEKNVALTLTVDELLTAQADIKLVLDTNTSEAPEKPTADGAYVISGEDSYDGIADILTDFAKGLFGGSSSELTAIDPDVVGLWATHYDADSLIYFEFFEDGTGIYGSDPIGYGYLVVETNVETDEITLYYVDEDGNVQDTYVGSYVVSDGTLYITADGYTDELWKIEQDADI